MIIDRLALLAVLQAAALLTGGAAAAQGLAGAQEIRASIVDKTIDGGSYVETYAADGTIRRGSDQIGVWELRGDEMCFSYDNSGGAFDCWQLRIEGATVTWVSGGRDDGTATIVEVKEREVAGRCGPVVAWAREAEGQGHLDRRVGWQGPLYNELRLPGGFLTEQAAALFGPGPGDWTSEDFQRVSALLRDCHGETSDESERSALRSADALREAGERYARGTAGAARRVPEALAQVDAQPFEPSILEFLVALAQGVRPDNLDPLLRASQSLPMPLRAGGMAELEIVRTWGYLTPEALAGQVAPEVARQTERRRAELLASLQQSLAALPQPSPGEAPDPRSLDGLARFENTPTLALLDAPRRSQLLAEIGERRGAITAALYARLEARLQAIQPGLDSFRELDWLRQDGSLQQLHPGLQAEFQGAVAARAAAIAPEVVALALAALEREGPSLDGVESALARYSELVMTLRRQGLPAEEAAYRAAADPPLARLVEAGIEGYRSSLAALPAEEASLEQLGADRQRFLDWPWSDLPAILPDAAPRFAAALALREQEIAAAIEAAEAGPLAGRAYGLASGFSAVQALEFLDGDRLLLSFSGGMTQAGTYEEIAGNRIVVTSADGNFVLRRAGRVLDGGQFAFARRPAR